MSVHVDVLVVGGGLAGVAAASCAAALGARTLLLEKERELGGNVAGAWVHTLCGVYSGDQAPPCYVNVGFPRCFTEGLWKAGLAGPLRSVGRVHVVPLEPTGVAQYCKRLCQERAGMMVWTGAKLGQVHLARQSRASTRGTIELRRRSVEFVARVAIDATGDAALAHAVGASTAVSPARRIQRPALIVKVGPVDHASATGVGALRVSAALAHAVKHGQLPAGCESVQLRPALAAGELFMSLSQPVDAEFDALVERSVKALYADAVERARHVVRFLSATRVEWARARILGVPRSLGIRESRRVVGQHVVASDELIAGSRPADEVAIAAWPMELWSDHRRARMRHLTMPSGIPLRALRSASHPELGMAGRCMSATQEALGSLRVLGTALATGQAVGVAGALACRDGRSLREVDASEVRESINVVDAKARGAGG